MFKLLVTAHDLDKVDRGFRPVLSTSAETATIIGWAKSESRARNVLADHFGPDEAREVESGQTREFWPISPRAARMLGLRKFLVWQVWEPASEPVESTEPDPTDPDPDTAASQTV